MNMLTELLFPRRCPVCDRPVDRLGSYICTDCVGKLKYNENAYCLKCGRGLDDNSMELCENCTKGVHYFDQGRVLYDYDSVKEAIFRLKYKNRMEYAEFFGKQMAAKLGNQIKRWNPEAIVSVPLYKTRERERGYNQSALISKVLSGELEIPLEENLIARIRPTVSQKSLKGKDRQNNLKNAFKIQQNDVKLKTIIVVDDVYTTGATMDEVARCLKEAGIQKVYCISLAAGRGI